MHENGTEPAAPPAIRHSVSRQKKRRNATPVTAWRMERIMNAKSTDGFTEKGPHACIPGEPETKKEPDVSESESLVEEVFGDIKNKIITRQYTPGEKLTVRKLREDYGISETPVKLALNRLAASGLVESVPYKGMWVRKFEFQEIKDIFEARLMIELFCKDAVIETIKRDESYAVRLQRLLQESNRAVGYCIEHHTSENFDACTPHDNALHMALVESCRNPQIISLYEGLRTHLAMYWSFEGHTVERLRTVSREHEEIVKAAVLCDGEGLGKHIARHIYGTVQIFREVLC